MTTEAAKTLDLEAIEKRCKAASDGPWESASVMLGGSNERASWSQSPWRIVNGPPQVIQDEMASKRAFTRKEDADFIAHARTDIPALLAALKERDEKLKEWELHALEAQVPDLEAEIERLKAENAGLRKQIEEHRHHAMEKWDI